ncbi:hypothetical protein JCM8097_006299 [Rhodosporidiobolus ruineniae]
MSHQLDVACPRPLRPQAAARGEGGIAQPRGVGPDKDEGSEGQRERADEGKEQLKGVQHEQRADKENLASSPPPASTRSSSRSQLRRSPSASPKQHSFPSSSLAPRPSPPQARRTASAPLPFQGGALFHPYPRPLLAAASNEGLGGWIEAREEGEREGGDEKETDALAFDELREILLAPASSAAPLSPRELPILLPPRTPSRTHSHSHANSGRTSRNGHSHASSHHHSPGHVRRRSSISGSAGGSSFGTGGTGGTGVSELGALVGFGAAGSGILRVRTPQRVVGWDGEYYSPPSRALTRNPFASHSFPSRRLHTHSALPVMEHPLPLPFSAGAAVGEEKKASEEEKTE